MSRPSASAGFTLLEVLVALVVLAVALVALTHTAASEIAQFTALRQRTLAGWVAANALTELRLQAGLPDVGEHQGQTTLAHRQWHYTLVVSDTPASGIRRMHVEVFEPGSATPVGDATPLLTMDGFVGQSLQR